MIGIAIVALSVTPSVAASTTQPAPLTDDGPQLQALVGDPAELDATFGTGGKVMTNTGGHRAFAVALQSDGKIVVAGEGNNDVAFGFARYTTTGSPRPSFDGDGIANVDVGFSTSPWTWPSSPTARSWSSGRTRPTVSAALLQLCG